MQPSTLYVGGSVVNHGAGPDRADVADGDAHRAPPPTENSPAHAAHLDAVALGDGRLLELLPVAEQAD